MKKFLFLFLSVFLVLEAKNFTHCQNYYKEATQKIGENYAFNVKYGESSYLVMHSKTPLNGRNIIKKDRFLGLYLLDSSAKKSYTLKPLDDFSRTNELASINATQAIKGRVINFKGGIFDLGRFSSNLAKNSVVSNICYQIYGFSVDSNRFVPKHLIDRFLSKKGGIYGDIGVRLSENSNKLIVKDIDIFFSNNPFLPNDEILKINNVSLKNKNDFEWIVADLTPNEAIQVQVKRNGLLKTLNLRAGERFGGGLVSDHFFERFGVILDSSLTFKKIPLRLPFNLSQLSEGDKIIWINKVRIKENDNFSHLRNALTKAWLQGEAELLVLHEGVEIFIRTKLK